MPCMRWAACRAGWGMFAQRRHACRAAAAGPTAAAAAAALTRAVGLLPLVLGAAPSLPGLCCAASMPGRGRWSLERRAGGSGFGGGSGQGPARCHGTEETMHSPDVGVRRADAAPGIPCKLGLPKRLAKSAHSPQTPRSPAYRLRHAPQHN